VTPRIGYNEPVPAPTNPRKKSLMPSSPLRRQLRAAGHHLAPVVQVGKEGLTDAVVRQLDDALAHHELVKLKVGTESPDDRFEVAEALGGRTGAQIAQILGRTVLAYRRHPEKPRYEAATAPPPASGEGAAMRRRGARAGKPAGRGSKPAPRGAGKRPAPRKPGGAAAARRPRGR
jgi:RNA-binding protein